MPGWLNRNLFWLLTARFLRSISQAFLIIVVPIYLSKLGFSAVQVGLIFTITTIAGILFVLWVGFVSDRFGRKPVLIILAALGAVSATGFLFTTNYWLLALLCAIGTIGRGGGAGSGGAFGPFYPAEQALITEHALPAYRNNVFGSLSFVGTLGSAIGSLLAILPHHLPNLWHLGWRGGYLLLMAVAVILNILLTLVILPVRENKKRPRRSAALQLSWKLLGKFSLTNAVNGLGIGFLGPFLTFWFFKRYGAGTAAIGALFTAVNLVTALPYLLSAPLARLLGLVRTVVLTRLAAVALMLLMCFMPNFTLAGIFFTLRMMANALGNPLRQSFVMGASREEERSSMAALSNLPQQLTSSLGPTIGGYLIDYSLTTVPIILASFFQLANAALYWHFFAGADERG